MVAFPDARQASFADTQGIDLASASQTRRPTFIFRAPADNEFGLQIFTCQQPEIVCISIKQMLIDVYESVDTADTNLLLRMESLNLHLLDRAYHGQLALMVDAARFEGSDVPVVIMALFMPHDQKVRWFYHQLSLVPVGDLLRHLSEDLGLLSLRYSWNAGELAHDRFYVFMRDTFQATMRIPHHPDYLRAQGIPDYCVPTLHPGTAVRRLEGNPTLYFAHRSAEAVCDRSMLDDRYVHEIPLEEREAVRIGNFHCARYMFVKRSFFKAFWGDLLTAAKNREFERSDTPENEPEKETIEQPSTAVSAFGTPVSSSTRPLASFSPAIDEAGLEGNVDMTVKNDSRKDSAATSTSRPVLPTRRSTRTRERTARAIAAEEDEAGARPAQSRSVSHTPIKQLVVKLGKSTPEPHDSDPSLALQDSPGPSTSLVDQNHAADVKTVIPASYTNLKAVSAALAETDVNLLPTVGTIVRASSAAAEAAAGPASVQPGSAQSQKQSNNDDDDDDDDDNSAGRERPSQHDQNQRTRKPNRPTPTNQHNSRSRQRPQQRQPHNGRPVIHSTTGGGGRSSSNNNKSKNKNKNNNNNVLRVRTDAAHASWLERNLGMKVSRARLLVVAWRELGFLDQNRYERWIRRGGPPWLEKNENSSTCSSTSSEENEEEEEDEDEDESGENDDDDDRNVDDEMRDAAETIEGEHAAAAAAAAADDGDNANVDVDGDVDAEGTTDDEPT